MSPHPSSKKGLFGAPQIKGQTRRHHIEPTIRSNNMLDTAANDRFIPVIDVDIFNESPGFFQKLPFFSSAWIMRLFIAAAITGSVFFIYPSSLAMVTTGIDKLTKKLSGIQLAADSKKVSPVSLAQAADIDNQTENLKDMLNQVASEIAAIDESQQQNDAGGQSNLKELNQALRARFEQRPVSKTIEKNNQQKFAFADSRAMRTTASKIGAISSTEISQLLYKYSTSYRNGDALNLAKLFMEFDVEQQLHEKLRQNYDALFDSSKQQWVEFQDLNWVHKNNKSVGTGFIESESTLRDNRRRTSSANVVISLQRIGNEIKIAKLTLSNQRSKLLLGANNNSNNNSNNNAKNTRDNSDSTTLRAQDTASTTVPSLTELDGVVSRFVWAYEGGKIDVLDRLLANNVISNNSSKKADIKKDYIELFATTNDRRLMISDLRWTFGSKHAKGVGTLKAIVQNDKNKTTTVNGKIQFVAKKINNQVLITHLYHIDSSQ